MAETGRDIWASQMLEVGESGHWCVGPLELWIRREAREWRVASLSSGEALASARSFERAMDAAAPEGAEVSRYVARETSGVVRLAPGLADRPVVVRPEFPLHIVSGAEVTIFLGSQLWVDVLVGENERELVSLPTRRPSDTWFGPTTLVGELSYASTTSARMAVDELPLRPARVVTRVQVRNRAADNLLLERVSVPVPNLAVFRGSDGRLWSQSIVLTRDEDGGSVDVRIERDAPAEAGKSEQVATPRVVVAGNVFRRALGGLLG